MCESRDRETCTAHSDQVCAADHAAAVRDGRGRRGRAEEGKTSAREFLLEGGPGRGVRTDDTAERRTRKRCRRWTEKS